MVLSRMKLPISLLSSHVIGTYTVLQLYGVVRSTVLQERYCSLLVNDSRTTDRVREGLQR